MSPVSERRQTLADIARLVSGTAIAQAAPLLVSPILTRQYSPEEFGVFGVFAALLMGLSIVASGRYEIATPLPRSPRKAFHILVLSLAIAMAVSVVLLALTAALAWSGIALPGISGRAGRWILLLLGPGTLLGAVGQSCSFWLTRTRAYSAVSRARAAQGLVTAAASVLLGWAGAGAEGLALALVLGSAVAGIAQAWAVLRTERWQLRSISRRSLSGLAREYSEFPLVNASHALLDAAKESGTLMLVSTLGGATSAGFLTQTMRVLRAPMSLIGQAVSQVFFPRASRAHAEGRSLAAETRRTLAGLAIAALAIYLPVLFFGTQLFAWVFGEAWRVSGEYAQILFPWLALTFVLSPVSLLPVVRRRQLSALALNGADAMVRLLTVVAGMSLGGARGAVVAMSAGGTAVALFQLWWYLRLASDVSPSPAAGIRA